MFSFIFLFVSVAQPGPALPAFCPHLFAQGIAGILGKVTHFSLFNEQFFQYFSESPPISPPPSVLVAGPTITFPVSPVEFCVCVLFFIDDPAIPLYITSFSDPPIAPSKASPAERDELYPQPFPTW